MEHATVHMLASQSPNIQLVGRSTDKGFYLYGNLETEHVNNAVKMAAARLPKDPTLAVHPRCGTNLAVTGLLTGLAAFLVAGLPARSGLDRLSRILTATLWAALLAQPLGSLVQSKVTTDSNIGEVKLAETQRQNGRVTSHFVPLIWEK